MRNILRNIVLGISLICLCLLSSCHEDIVSDDSSLALTFSTDTLRFDTVFTTIGSSTQQLMVYNTNRNAVRIHRVWMAHNQYFHVNMDGETDLTRLTDIELRGGDSLYIFVSVNINPQSANTPVLVDDTLSLEVNGKIQSLRLEAYGQNVKIIRTPERRTEINTKMTFTAELPYLIYDTLLLGKEVKMEAGAHIYMHQNASIYIYGSLTADGTKDLPIRIMGDRLDYLFTDVPYAYAAGSWGGIYLVDDGKDMFAPTYKLTNIEILSGNVGLYGYSTRSKALPRLTLRNARLHNHSLYGLALFNVNADIINTEISNAASYCVYLEGGKHRFIHTTIADYFRHTDVNIQSTPRDTVATVYISDLSKSGPRTEASFINSVITGSTRRNLVIATPLEQYYVGEFFGCYLKTDTLRIPHAHNNVYYQDEDTARVFMNDFYKYQDWTYYDFRPAENSPIRQIADSAASIPYPLDRNDIERPKQGKADAGCYEYQSQQ